ncbi:hypothetical protein [Sulfurisphaera tokodaii]|nr:hypothetical protein [Sulfurisphaera tokodaii]
MATAAPPINLSITFFSLALSTISFPLSKSCSLVIAISFHHKFG